MGVTPPGDCGARVPAGAARHWRGPRVDGCVQGGERRQEHGDLLSSEDDSGHEADWEQALNVNPRKRVALTDRGQLYEQMERYPEAIADYEAALQLQPDANLQQHVEFLEQR